MPPQFRILGLVFTVILTVGCASQPEGGTGPGGESKQTEPASLFSSLSPEGHAASRFARFLAGELTPAEILQEKQLCQANPKNNRFCYSWQQSNHILPLIQQRHRPPYFPEPKVVTPIPVELTAKGVKDWNKLRKEKIPQLIKGMTGFTIEQTKQVARQALKEKRCPNNLAVVAAATLEDFLPDRVKPEEIATLYERAARCTRGAPVDREHFYTRAGLLFYLAGQDKEAIRLFGKVRPADALSGRALFWKYRANLRANHTAAAEKAQAELLRKFRFSFHAVLASQIAGQDKGAALLEEKSVSQRRSTKSPLTNEILGQLETLKEMNLSANSGILVDWALKRFKRIEPETRVYLVSLGEPRLQILTVSDLLLRYPKLTTRETMQLLYPLAYGDFFEKQKSYTDPLLLAAVARKESSFDPKAISLANAQGLLQVQPATAEKVLAQSSPRLLEPEANIEVAARYLNQLAGRHGKLPLVLASYNAGEDPVKVWTTRYPMTDPVLFIDLIPYRETRDYVAAVLANYYWYKRIYASTSPFPFAELLEKEVAATPKTGS